jgi:S1-C subfamily serine protease
MRPAEIIEQIRAMFARLSKRERLMVIGAALGMLALISLITVVRVSGAMADRQSRIAYKENGLRQVVSLSAGFREAQAEQRRLESQLRGQANVSLFSHIEELARAQGVSISNMTPRQPVTEGGIREETVEVSLESVTVDKVAGLVNAIQRSPHMVKVTSLRVRRRGGGNEVQASLTVSSYALARTG